MLIVHFILPDVNYVVPIQSFFNSDNGFISKPIPVSHHQEEKSFSWLDTSRLLWKNALFCFPCLHVIV